MSQETVFGDATVDAVFVIDRANGTREFYRVAGTQNIPITEDEYREATS